MGEGGKHVNTGSQTAGERQAEAMVRFLGQLELQAYLRRHPAWTQGQ